MSVQYHCVLKNQAGSQVALIDDWRVLAFSRIVNGVSALELELWGLDSKVSLFAIDGQIEVYRSDLEHGITPYKEFECLVRAFERRVDINGDRIFRVEARGYNDILARRIIAYFAGTAFAEKSGAAETVLKSYVDQNAGPNANNVNRIANGVTAGLTIQTDGAAGATWTGSRAYRNLLDVCQEIGATVGMDFDVIGTGAATYQFRTYNGQRGLDRTTVGLNPTTGLNGAGNRPHVFALGFGNMGLPVYRDSRVKEANAVFVLGQGAESSRTVVQRTNASAIAVSPINRREIARDARDESAVGGLNARGDALLEEFQRQQSFGFEFISTPASQYGRDFTFGDLITAQFDEISADKKIIGVNVRVQARGEQPAETIRLQLADTSYR